MFAPEVIVYDSFVWKRTKGDDITNDAKLSFLARTRNLVSRPALCYRGQCADIEKRSLV